MNAKILTSLCVSTILFIEDMHRNSLYNKKEYAVVYEEERKINALAYIALIHKSLTQKPAFQTYIYKYTALIDFTAIKECGRPVFNFDYLALKNGPVPKQLYDNKEEYLKTQPFKDKILLKKDENRIIYEPTGEPDLEYFSDYEIELIEKIVEKHAKKYITTGVICNVMHKEILAWQKAWENRENKKRVPINPLETFPGILSKKALDRTPVEEVAVRYFLNR